MTLGQKIAAILGPGTHVLSFSGGRSSAYLVWLMEQARQAGADVHFVFMDTGAEHPRTYDFIRDVVAHWGIPLVCIRVEYNPVLGKGNGYRIVPVADIGPDLQPWLGMVTKYGCPQVSMPFCTARMKTEPYDKYCDEVFGKGQYTTWLGIRADEPGRLRNRPGIRYLAELSDFEKLDVLAWFKLQPFDLQLTEHLGNCVFCIKKGLNKVALAAMDEPELAAEFIRIVEGDHVRLEGRKHAHKRMYRKSNHLSDVIAMYADHDRDELYGRTAAAKQYESGSCSESCEVFRTDSTYDELIGDPPPSPHPNDNRTIDTGNRGFRSPSISTGE